MAYCREQLLIMEKRVLEKLEWNLTVPTTYLFLLRLLKASVADKEYAVIKYSSSMIAASVVYAAWCTLKKSPLWSEKLKHHTGFSKPQLLDCSQLLLDFHSLAAEGSKLKVVYDKYANPDRSSVFVRPLATMLSENLKGAELVHHSIGVFDIN